MENISKRIVSFLRICRDFDIVTIARYTNCMFSHFTARYIPNNFILDNVLYTGITPLLLPLTNQNTIFGDTGRSDLSAFGHEAHDVSDRQNIVQLTPNHASKVSFL